MNLRAVAVFLISTLSLAAETTKRPLTHEDVWLMKRVGAPEVSPDGKWAVFSVIEPAYDAKDQVSDLWIRSLTEDLPPHRLTSTKSAESGVSWSRDSRKIAFSSKREGDEVAQIYVLDLALGGEAERLTTVSTGARAPQWSPDGKRILFVSEVYPGALDDEANRKIAKERHDRKYNARTYDSFPIHYWDKWLDEKRAHILVQDAVSTAKPHDLLAGTKLAALKGFGGREADAGEEIDAAWTPDGSGIVFAARTERDHAAYAQVNTQLFQVSAEGGEPKALTSGKDSYSRPQFLPTGDALLVHSEAGGDTKIYHVTRIARFPWPFVEAKREILTAKSDRSALRFSVTGDGKTVYFTAEIEGDERLFRVPSAGGEVTESGDLLHGCTTNVSVGGNVVVANWESATHPAELVRIDPDKSQHAMLSRFNADRLTALDLPEVEHFWITSAKGRRVHNLLLRPPGFDPSKKYPLFVVMHGGPANMTRDAFSLRWNYHLLSAPGYVILQTNYTGSTGFGEAFGQAIQEDPLKTPGDEIDQAVNEALKKYSFIDPNLLVAGGASYGGHLANWLEATTTRYRCLVAHSGLVNLESQWATSDIVYSRELTNGGPIWEQGPVWREQNPIRLVGNHAKKTGWITPMLMSVGEQDFRVPINNTEENWSYHQRLQIPSKLLVFPDANHWILKGEDSRFWYGEVHAWLAKWISAARTSSGGT